MEMKDLENHNNQLNWRSSPHSILVNGATDYCSLSTSSSETANLNEHAEVQSNLETEPIHQESPVSVIIPHLPSSALEERIDTDPVSLAACLMLMCDLALSEQLQFLFQRQSES